MKRMETDCVSKGDKIMVRIKYLFQTDYITGVIISDSLFPEPHGSYIIFVDANCRHKVNNLKYKRCPVEDIVCVVHKKEERKVDKIERKILEKFKHDGVELMCVKAQKENSCNGCWYKKDEKSPCMIDRKVAGECIGKYRSDWNDVIFMLVYPIPRNKPNTNYYLIEICSPTPNESYRINKIVVSENPLTREEILTKINLPYDYITKIEILEDANGK